MKQHAAILEDGVLDPKSTVVAIFPSPMMYAGPTEVTIFLVCNHKWHCQPWWNISGPMACQVQDLCWSHLLHCWTWSSRYASSGSTKKGPVWGNSWIQNSGHGARYNFFREIVNDFNVLFAGLKQLEIIPFRVAAYDKKAGQMAFFDPKRRDDFDFISGTRMRALARYKYF